MHLLMKSLAMTVLSLSMAAAAHAQGIPELKINRNGSQPSTAGPADDFTGSVRVDARFSTDAPARVGGRLVTFEPSARTAWHTHPLGQTLIVTHGVGLVQVWGGPVQEIRPGDVVSIPAGAEQLDGKSVDWLEKVTDQQYRAPR
jgi:quercetin dioxygenase-like cupin family protein